MRKTISVKPTSVLARPTTVNSAGFEVQAFDNIQGWRSASRTFATEELALTELAHQSSRAFTATVSRRVYESLIQPPKVVPAWAKWFTFLSKPA